MARKKSGPPDDVPPPGMADAAGMLATFAAGVLGQPASRAHEVSLKLGRSERAILVGVPGSGREVEGAARHPLDRRQVVPRSRWTSWPASAWPCPRRLLDAEGRDAVKLLKVTGKVTDLLNQAIAEVEQAGKPRRAAPKAGKTTAKPKATRATGTVYQLKVTLKDIKPPVWRRLLVPDCSLAKLHEVIQVAMGWENYHLYDFEVGGEHYTDPRGMADLDMEDASRVKLGQVAPEGKAKFRYTYDFGDNWQHEVLVEKVVPPEEGRRTRSASTASGPARRRTWAGRGATWSSPRRSETRSTSSTRSSWSGGASSTPRRSTSTP